MAVTLAALSLVRENLLGSVEMFRVAPVGSMQIIIGKYLAYTLFAGVIAAMLTSALIMVRRPIGWKYLVVCAVGAVADLGIVGPGLPDLGGIQVGKSGSPILDDRAAWVGLFFGILPASRELYSASTRCRACVPSDERGSGIAKRHATRPIPDIAALGGLGTHCVGLFPASMAAMAGKS